MKIKYAQSSMTLYVTATYIFEHLSPATIIQNFAGSGARFPFFKPSSLKDLNVIDAVRQIELKVSVNYYILASF